MSNSIEERVVSMKFNNSQFEAGVKTTMSSLDNLKKSLDFQASVKSLGDLNAQKIDLKFDNKAFDAGVQGTIKSANNLKGELKFDGAVKALGDLNTAGQRVVLKIDGQTFKDGAAKVVEGVTTIKQNMNFEGVQKGIGYLQSSVSNFSMSNVISNMSGALHSIDEIQVFGKSFSLKPIADGIDKISSKFDGMSVIGIAALATLSSKAVDFGLQMGQKLFANAQAGLQEYETNLNSIQTILANTASKGTTLVDVNSALDELNAYSDKTIYSFSEMANAVGKFTSAGVDLKTSVASIKGLSNVAAVSGANATQAATAMQQMSQAIASGTIHAQDWMSVENAGMSSEAFRNALIQTAKVHGVAVEDMIKKNGSFKASLQEDWLTADFMNETLNKFTGDLTNEQLKSMGYTDDQIVGIQQMAKQAADAATVIKTFSALTGTLAENTGSGWATTWKYILGDFEEAKTMWTSVYGVLGGMVQQSADNRNKILKDWHDLGGRTEMIWAVRAAFMNLMAIVKPIQDAFREVFPPKTGEDLYKITQAIRLFIEGAAPSPGLIHAIHGAFKLLFVIIKIGVDIIGGILGVVFKLFQAFATGGKSLAGPGQQLGDFFEKLANGLQNSQVVKEFFDLLGKGAELLGKALAIGLPYLLKFTSILGQGLYDASGNAMYALSGLARVIIAAIGGFLDGGLETALTRVRERIASMGRFGEMLVGMWDRVKASGKQAGDALKPVGEQFIKMFKDIGENIKNALTDVNFNDVLDMVNTGLLGGLVLLFRNLFKKIGGNNDKLVQGLLDTLKGSVSGIKDVLEGLTGTLEAMQQNLKADTLQKIAIAIGILTISVVALSLIDSGKLTKALIAIGVMVVILSKAMDALDKMSTGSGFLKIPFIAAALILLAIAIGILSISIVILSFISWGDIIKGLLGIGIMLLFLSKAVESMAKNPADLIATGIGLMAVAFAVKILVSAVKDFSGLSWGDMIKGLIGVGVLLAELVLFNKFNEANKGSISSGIGLILLGSALKILASAVGDFASMNVGNMIQGLVAMGAVLLMLDKFTQSLGNNDNVFKSALAMVVMGAAIKIIASAVGDFAAMNLEQLAKGIIGMAIALREITIAMSNLPAGMMAKATGMILVGVALKIIASALGDMGGMSWETIAKGLITLGGAMLILAIGLNLMQGTLAGSAALLIAAVALNILAPALAALGNIQWDQLGMAMAALAAVFLVFGLAALILAPVVPVMLLLGVAVGLLGIGLGLVGIGTLAFVAGLAMLVAMGTVALPIIQTMVMGILDMIPYALTKLGEGIVSFAKVIGDAGPIFLQAFTALLMTLLQAISVLAPQIGQTLWDLIVMLCDLLVKALPLFVDSGMKIITGILEGIGNNIGKMVDAAVKVITEFIDGIARNIGKIIDSGANLIVKFVQGLADSIKSHSDEMANAGADLAGNIIDGMANGIGRMAGRVMGAIGRVAEDALNAAKKALGIASPSKEFFAIGRWTMLGWANAVDKHGSLVTDSTESVANAALDTLKATMANMNDQVAGEMTVNPVITPVLDLSAIKRDAGLVNGMIQTPTLALDSTYNKMSTVARATSGNQDVTPIVTKTNPGSNLTLVQNNFSPKALSSAEIYRNTKNQLSQVKGVRDTNAV